MSWPLRILIVIPFLMLALPVRADVVTDWNALIRQTFASENSSTSPLLNSRTMGMLGGAMFDAVNSVNRSYQPYLGYYDPTTAGISIDMDAAAATAAYNVLTSVYTERFGAGNAYQQAFSAQYTQQMNAIATSDGKTRGIEVGAAAAAAMIAQRTGDGWNAASSYTAQAPGTLGRWQPDSSTGAWGSNTGTFLQAQWGGVKPFTLTTGGQFHPGGPGGYQPASYTSWVQSSAYTAEFDQVKSLGALNSSTRTIDQTEIARFWADGPGSASAPGHWNRIAQTISASAGLSLEQNARLFALLNLAAADTGIATWEAKTFYDTWRPLLAITTADSDGNPSTLVDASWQSLLPASSFAAYVSDTSAFGSAAATILAQFFGTDAVSFTADSESLVGVTRAYTSLSSAAAEAGMSGIYGGTQWMSDLTAGSTLGAAVANRTVENFLLPVPEPSGILLLASSGLLLLQRRRR